MVAPTKLTLDQKKIDLKLSMYILFHTSIRSIDHLGEMLNAEMTNLPGSNNSFNNIRLHHTKCAGLIRNVIGAVYLKQIVSSVGNQKYSCIIDESTDVSVNKYLAVCIRYFNGNAVTTDFLGLIEIERATAQVLFESLQMYFQKIGLPIQNMLALGTDGGQNLCGKNNSVYTLLKKDNKHLCLLKCICHAIHLCVSKASMELPSCLDFLAHEIYNWFSNSPLRKIEYRRLYDLININENN